MFLDIRTDGLQNIPDENGIMDITKALSTIN
jgi:hypothetical protein